MAVRGPVVHDAACVIKGEDTVLYVGTALGSQSETASFVENMILNDEKHPRPAKFVNSVHNALASHVAITFGLKGRGVTVTHDEASFELALERAVKDLVYRRAEQAVVIGADELNPYPVAVGRHYGWWRKEDAPLRPMAAPPQALPGTLPGEGAGAFLLCAQPGGGARGGAVLLRAAAHARTSGSADPEHNADAAACFITDVLKAREGSLSDVDFILFGANGDCALDRTYSGVLGALNASSGRTLSFGVFKHLCGEFCTASAIGLGIAVEAVRAGRIPREVYPYGVSEESGEVASVLLYHRHTSGFQSVVWVTA